MSTMVKEDIVIEGHYGTWYVVSEVVFHGEYHYMLEHEEYGDEVPSIIVKRDMSVVLEYVWNGWRDLYETESLTKVESDDEWEDDDEEGDEDYD